MRLFCRKPSQARTIRIILCIYYTIYAKKHSSIFNRIRVGRCNGVGLCAILRFPDSYHRNRRLMLLLAKNKIASKRMDIGLQLWSWLILRRHLLDLHKPARFWRHALVVRGVLHILFVRVYGAICRFGRLFQQKTKR